MRVDILPALALAAGLEPQAAADAWEKARASALRDNGDRDDTRAFALTVENFRQAHAFDYAALRPQRAAQRAGNAADSPSTP